MITAAGKARVVERAWRLTLIQLSFCSERMYPKIKRIKMCWIPKESNLTKLERKLKELCGYRSRSRNFTELNLISAI